MMHKVESILFGIALILFGIASILIAKVTNFGFFEVTGIVFPFLGLISATIGVFDNGEKNNKDDE